MWLASSAGFAADAGIQVSDAHVVVVSAKSQTAAAFMTLESMVPEGDRLVAARASAASRVELHTHEESADGVVRMREVEEGFAIPGNGERRLERGKDHVMLIGLLEPLEDGGVVELTLVFERAGEVTVKASVVSHGSWFRRLFHRGH